MPNLFKKFSNKRFSGINQAQTRVGRRLLPLCSWGNRNNNINQCRRLSVTGQTMWRKLSRRNKQRTLLFIAVIAMIHMIWISILPYLCRQLSPSTPPYLTISGRECTFSTMLQVLYNVMPPPQRVAIPLINPSFAVNAITKHTSKFVG